MELKIASHPNGTNITFDEDKHLYYTDKVKNFTSGTTFIHQFFPKFDEEKKSKNYAKKHKISQEEVLAQWHKKKDDACELGTNVHLYCENYLLGIPAPAPINEKAAKYFIKGKEACDKILKKYELVETEKIVFSESLKISGMLDILMRDRISKRLFILDWKTNKKIELKTMFNKYGLPPISNIEDTNFWHYTLQLNLYKYLMLKEKYYDEPIDLAIIHLTEKDPVWYDLGDYSKTIKTMIEHFKNKK